MDPDTAQLPDSIPILKEDSAQMSLFPENWSITIDAADTGTRLYVQHCATCHLPGGEGVAGLIPPLINSNWAGNDKQRIIKAVLEGLSSEIEVNGVKYHQEMPGFSASLTDEDIASILTFINKNFLNDPEEIQPAEIKEHRQQL